MPIFVPQTLKIIRRGREFIQGFFPKFSKLSSWAIKTEFFYLVKVVDWPIWIPLSHLIICMSVYNGCNQTLFIRFFWNYFRPFNIRSLNRNTTQNTGLLKARERFPNGVTHICIDFELHCPLADFLVSQRLVNEP